MHSLEPTIHRIPDEPPRQVADEALCEAVAAAQALIATGRDSPVALGPDLEYGFGDLERRLADALKLKPGSAEYLLADVLKDVAIVAIVATNQLSRAREDLQASRQELRMLGQVPQASDYSDVLIDQECREQVRGMAAKQRAEFIAQMRDGEHLRATLALARGPIVGDLETEAAAIYQAKSNPTRRTNFTMLIEIAEARIKGARSLAEAAEATRCAVELCVQTSQASRRASQTGTAPSIAYGPAIDGASRAAASPPPALPVAMVVREGSAITYID